jgi:hypothetical protein
MTEVSYEPRKKVIIHEYSRYDSVEELVRCGFAGAPPGSNAIIRWVDGIVLSHNPYPMTDSITTELIEGRLHWDHVSFAPMEEYQANLSFANLPMTVTVVDVSVNPVFCDIARFIKEKLMKRNLRPNRAARRTSVKVRS